MGQSKKKLKILAREQRKKEKKKNGLINKKNELTSKDVMKVNGKDAEKWPKEGKQAKKPSLNKYYQEKCLSLNKHMKTDFLSHFFNYKIEWIWWLGKRSIIQRKSQHDFQDKGVEVKCSGLVQ